MKTIEKWDKKSSINGIAAERVLESNPSFAMANIYLVKNGNRVERIEDVEIIRSNTDYEGTDAEVMNQFLASINEPNKTLVENMSRKELVSALQGKINERINALILSGFVWRDMAVWLSAENQSNYKAAYDLAFQAQAMQMPFSPVKFKFGTDEEVIYHVFTDFGELADFFTKAVKHIQDCYQKGWDEKDALVVLTDEELRNLLKQ